MISRLLNLVKPLFRTTFLVCEGISSAEISVVGMITVDTNQNTQLQLTYSTKRAPVIRPKRCPLPPKLQTMQ
jgi:ribosome biogenesis SPOUT family RNA methylase Rps3